ncbi:MAG: hypothetical protein ACRDQX_06645 [Pseudonocardiaceae bacterium]
MDNGHPGGPGLSGSMPTSSASSPVIVAVMLTALGAHAGHRVLEVGAGTGYNAALLTMAGVVVLAVAGEVGC